MYTLLHPIVQSDQDRPNHRLSSSLDLPDTLEGGLLLLGLELSVTELGRSVDELELGLLEVGPRGVDSERFSEDDVSLLGADNGSLEHDKVVLDDTVVGEATDGGDALLRDVEGRRSRVLVGTVGNSVDPTEELASMSTRSSSTANSLQVLHRSPVETSLTSSRNREHDLTRVPSSNTGDLS